MVTHKIKIGLPTSINAIKIIPHKHNQKFIPQEDLESIKFGKCRILVLAVQILRVNDNSFLPGMLVM